LSFLQTLKTAKLSCFQQRYFSVTQNTLTLAFIKLKTKFYASRQTTDAVLKGQSQFEQSSHQRSNRTNGLLLFNLLKKLQKDGVIISEGEDPNITISLVESNDEEYIEENIEPSFFV
jgi:hypothetical protein